MPHLLFYGPPGTGKTSTIVAIAQQLYGPEMYKTRVLELNASDERGISVIRDKVKSFAQLSANAPPVKGYPCPAYKIIILDEADAMTSDAQSALRRTMEQYSKITRFCLICNYVSRSVVGCSLEASDEGEKRVGLALSVLWKNEKTEARVHVVVPAVCDSLEPHSRFTIPPLTVLRIIEPLASRCAKFRFKPLPMDAQMHRMSQIRDNEDVKCSDDGLRVLVSLSGGDLRQAITFLQSAHRLKGGAEITAKELHSIAGVMPDGDVAHMLEECRSGSFERVQVAVTNMTASGFTASQVLLQV